MDVYQNRMANREELLVDASDRQIRQYRNLQKLNNKSEYIKNLFISDEEQQAIKEELDQLIDSQKELLQTIVDLEEKYILALSELDFTEQNLLNVATQFKTLIDENLLWERSSKLISIEELGDFWQEISFFLNPKRWYAIITSMLEQFLYKPFLGVLLFVALFITLKRRMIQRAINETNENVAKIANDSFVSHMAFTGLVCIVRGLLVIGVSVFCFSKFEQSYGKFFYQWCQ